VDALMHHPTLGEIQILAVLDHRHVEHLRIFERAAKELAVHDWLAIIGNADYTRFEHLAYFRERFTFLFFRNSADGKHVGRRRPFCFGDDVMRDRRIVVRRLRIRHRCDRGKTTGNSGVATGGNRLGFFRAGFAKVDMDIEKARSDNQPIRIEDRKIGPVGAPDFPDLAVTNDDVGHLVQVSGGIDNPAVFDNQIHHPPSSRYSTAMRTATPEATWSRMTEYGPSATSVAISTPRFIGPGCMMMTS